MSEVDEVLRLIDELEKRKFLAAHVQVGSVSVKLGGLLEQGGSVMDQFEEETEEELKRRMDREAEEMFATQYASSLGGPGRLPD